MSNLKIIIAISVILSGCGGVTVEREYYDDGSIMREKYYTNGHLDSSFNYFGDLKKHTYIEYFDRGKNYKQVQFTYGDNNFMESSSLSLNDTSSEPCCVGIIYSEFVEYIDIYGSKKKSLRRYSEKNGYPENDIVEHWYENGNRERISATYYFTAGERAGEMKCRNDTTFSTDGKIARTNYETFLPKIWNERGSWTETRTTVSYDENGDSTVVYYNWKK